MLFRSAIKKSDKSKVIIGLPESMSKSKKNTIDPEVMIEKYGADAVRWFILSDSPPEKDIQWSDTGVAASNKFLQKIWNLSSLIIKRPDKSSNENQENKLENIIDGLSSKIDSAINNFKFNVAIAHFYESYNILNHYINLDVGNKLLANCITKIMKLMLPITPHLANEILDLLNCKSKNIWPSIKKDVVDEIKFAVQINGKTRDVINIKKDLLEKQINKFIMENSKTKRFFDNKTVIKTIFVKNKIINYIIK